MNNLKFLNKYLAKYKLRLLLGTLFVALANYFQVLVPKVIGDALDYIQNNITVLQENEGTNSFFDLFGSEVLKFSGIVIGFALLNGFFMYCMRKTIIVMSRLIEYDIRKEIYMHYQTMDLAFFKKNKIGDLMSRISEDVGKVRMYLGPAIMYGIRVALLFSFVIYAMISENPTLALYSLLPLPILSISIYYVSSIIHKRTDMIQRQVAKLNSTSQEVYSGISIVKSYVKENQFLKFFEKQSEDYKQKSLDLSKVNALFFPLMILLVGISNLLMLAVGGKLYAQGEITMGTIAQFVIYIQYLTWPITSIGWIASIVNQADASQQRINTILNTKAEIVNISDATKALKGQIGFKNVSFTYPDTGIEALHNVSFDLKPGEKMAIVGRTAAGKSTIADLILRFYDVTTGEIEIDGENIKQLNLFNLRKKIGYVPQSVFLFSDTVENNIRFGKQDAKFEEIKSFAHKAAVGKDIEGFQEQYETFVGERGVTLSGGQKQRLSIARALIKEPDIIIFDDCLSAIDANTEHEILGFLNESLVNKTAIFITHRISSLLQFDKILVLDNGRIEEIGNHDELIDSGGYYSQIVKKQFNN